MRSMSTMDAREDGADNATDTWQSLRLRRHADFQSVYKRARKQYAREISFFFALRMREEDPPARDQRMLSPMSPLSSPVPDSAVGPRIGLTVGKVLGKAHERNRIKRRLRAAVQQHAGLLGQLPVDVVLHPRRTMLTLEWPRVEREIAQVFRTVRKLAEQPALAPADAVAQATSPRRSPAGAGDTRVGEKKRAPRRNGIQRSEGRQSGAGAEQV